MAAEYDYTEDLEPTSAKGKRLEAGALRAEAQRLVDKAIELERQAENAILVRFGNSTKVYAYSVPEGLALELGDSVTVPSWDGISESVAWIVGVGRAGYEGPLTEITGRVARFDEDDLIDPVDIGFGSCPDCGYAYHWEGQEPCEGRNPLA